MRPSPTMSWIAWFDLCCLLHEIEVCVASLGFFQQEGRLTDTTRMWLADHGHLCRGMGACIHHPASAGSLPGFALRVPV